MTQLVLLASTRTQVRTACLKKRTPASLTLRGRCPCKGVNVHELNSADALISTAAKGTLNMVIARHHDHGHAI